MDHIGIDVHKKHSQICLLTEDGELIERRVRTEAGQLAEVLGPRPRAHIVIESATESEWVARCLEALGHEVIVADPNFAPMDAQRRRNVRTDRRDARALAEASVLGAYRRAHRVSDDQRHVRGRLTVRAALVRTRTGYIAVIRSLLRQHGYRVRSGGADAFIQRVRDLPLPGRLLSEIGPLLAVMRQVNQQVAYSDEQIEAVTETDQRVRLLRSVPSVGPVTAAAFVAALDAVKRFRGAHEVESYLGLVPRELSSGESQRRGRITKAGPSRVRRLLVQAAVSILRLRDPRTWTCESPRRRPRPNDARIASAAMITPEGSRSSRRCGGSAYVALAAVRGRSVDGVPPRPRLPSCADEKPRHPRARIEG